MLKCSKKAKIARIATAGVSVIMCAAIICSLGGSQKPSSTVVESTSKPWALYSNNPLLNQGEDYYVDVEEPASKEVADFIDTPEVSLNDMKDLVEKLTENIDNEASDVDMYQIHEADQGLIFNPIYRESVSTGILDKYAKAYTTKGTIELGDTTLTYEIPKNATAYDTVPIKYTMKTKNTDYLPIYIGADANEEKGRVADDAQFYDLHYPNHVEMKFEYLGYVASEFDYDIRPNIDVNQATYASGYRIARTKTTADGVTVATDMDKTIRLLNGKIEGVHSLYLRNVDAGTIAVSAIRLYRADGTYDEIACDSKWALKSGAGENDGTKIKEFGNAGIVLIPNLDFGKNNYDKIAVVTEGTTADKTIDVYLDKLPDKLTEEHVGTAFPNIDNDELILSDEIETATTGWYKVKYTNIGDTAIDPEGGGYVELMPTLEKYNSNTGSWSAIGTYHNVYKHIPDVVYPGESGELWLYFGDGMTMTEGQYRLAIKVFTNHVSAPSVSKESMMRDGANGNPVNHTQVSYYTLNAKDGASVVTPEDATFENTNVMELVDRNEWIHTYEEFMYAYDTWLSPLEDIDYEGWLYLQVAPWTDHVTLKLVNDYDKSIKVVRVPLNVDTDSIQINFNPNNNNYVVNEEGKREPMIIAQNMTCMRTNFSYGPYADEVIAHQMLDWKECGINTITSTNGFFYDKNSMTWERASDAFKFSTDLARLMGIQYIGNMAYPYTGSEYDVNLTFGETVTLQDTAGFSDPIQELKNAVRAITLYDRWGDTYYRNAVDGKMPFYLEDTRGYFGYSWLSYRFPIGNLGKTEFQKFLKKVYGNIGDLNKAWSTDYESFDAVNPEDTEQKKNVFKDYTLPTRVWDIFRTVERVESYDTILQTVEDYIDNPTIFLQQENDSYLIQGINPNSTNPRYRYQALNAQQYGALIPEIIAASGTITAHGAYRNSRYYYSEVYEMTKREVANGIIPMWASLYGHTYDYGENPMYGSNVTELYNSKSSLYSMWIPTLTSAFMEWVAIYEAGGVPGTLWNDEACDGVVYATQKKEMIFFKQKLDEALATDAGKAWAAKGGASTYNPDGVEGKYSYDLAYLKEVLEKATKEHVNGAPPIM